MNGAGYHVLVRVCHYGVSLERLPLLLKEKSVKWPFHFTVDFSQLLIQ